MIIEDKRKLKFVKNKITDSPYPYIVMSFDDFFDSAPFLTERWSTKEDAMYYGKMRQDQGYVVQVMKELAHSINDA